MYIRLRRLIFGHLWCFSSQITGSNLITVILKINMTSHQVSVKQVFEWFRSNRHCYPRTNKRRNNKGKRRIEVPEELIR